MSNETGDLYWRLCNPQVLGVTPSPPPEVGHWGFAEHPQHRARIYDAPPPFTTIKLTPPSSVGPDDYAIVTPPWPRSWTFAAVDALAYGRFLEALDNAFKSCDMSIFYDHPPWSHWPYSTKRKYKAVAFAERHARHVERRRARVVGQLRRSAQPIE